MATPSPPPGTGFNTPTQQFFGGNNGAMTFSIKTTLIYIGNICSSADDMGLFMDILEPADLTALPSTATPLSSHHPPDLPLFNQIGGEPAILDWHQEFMTGCELHSAGYKNWTHAIE